MDYEKKDSENTAVKVIMRMIADGEISQEVAEKYFPELKESEDERIRKEMIFYFQTEIPQCSIQEHADKMREFIAWLEKQDDKSDANKEYWRGYREGKQEVLDKYSELEKQGEQKPANTDFSDLRIWKYIVDAAWTEKEGIGQYLDSPFTEEVAKKLQKRFGNIEQKPTELPKGDDYGIDGLYAAIDILQKTLGKVEGYQSDDGILEHKCAISAVKKLVEQKPAWSEEDNEMLDSIIEEVRYIGDFPDYPTKEEDELYDECLAKVEWLKSLRPQSQWKPSDEQMEALESATANCAYSEYQDCLHELIMQLKKLKG